MNGTLQITTAQLIISIVSAAGIGALTSSFITLLGQRLERKSRVRELLLSKSIDMAQKTTEMMLKMARPGDKLFPDIVTARWCHKQLTALFETGKLSDDMEKTFADFINKSHTQLEEEDKKKAAAPANKTSDSRLPRW
jgi:hypothetical protein